MPGGCWLQINVTYDASAAGAPAGFAQAVNAAVQFFDSTISNNITVNIAFGWGEVGGQSLDAGALGESNTNFLTGVSYSQLLSSLAIADAGSPGASGAVQGLPSTPPYYDSDFWIATAEAQDMPAPNPVSRASSPGLMRPFWRASSKASGIEADEVLP